MVDSKQQAHHEQARDLGAAAGSAEGASSSIPEQRRRGHERDREDYMDNRALIEEIMKGRALNEALLMESIQTAKFTGALHEELHEYRRQHPGRKSMFTMTPREKFSDVVTGVGIVAGGVLLATALITGANLVVKVLGGPSVV